MKIDYYTSVGFTLELLSQSTYHKHQPLGEYFDFEVFPAFSVDQVRFYQSKTGVPTAMVTWAWLSENVEADILKTGRALEENEWNCGNRLFFNDWVTPYGNVREVLHDMTHNIFPDEVGTSLRRNPDGSVRRINRWTGVNIRKVQVNENPCV